MTSPRKCFLLKGLEPSGYLLYSVLNDWQGGTLEEMYRKVWRVYTGVVHPYMMQQVAKVPLGSTPMEIDAFWQRPRSPQPERPHVGSGYTLLTGSDVGTTERRESYPRRSENYPRDYQQSERRWETRRREEEPRKRFSDSSRSPRDRREDQHSCPSYESNTVVKSPCFEKQKNP